MIVIGAGMAGLLAAGMLRQECDWVWEAQPTLPNNHSAVLRFRSSVVGDVLNIRFKQVSAIKAVHPWRNPVADAMSYSLKTNGTATLRSVLSASAEPVTRYIAPPDMIQQMATRVGARIQLSAGASKERLQLARSEGHSVISTVPMPTLMELLDWPGPRQTFAHIPGANYGTTLPGVNAYCSVYVPDPAYPFARVSLTGDELVAECYGETADAHDPGIVLEKAIHVLGLRFEMLRHHEPWVKKQRYAKILPMNESVRREFIMWASREWGVYSLGRYATWRPGLLLDDVVNDVRVIQRLAAEPGATYPHQLKGK